MTDEKVEEKVVENAEEQTDDTPEKTYNEKEVEELTEAARKAEFDKNNDQLSRVGAENKHLRDAADSRQSTQGTQQIDNQLKMLKTMKSGDDYTESPQRLANINQLEEELNTQRQWAAWDSSVAQKRGAVTQKMEEAKVNPNDESCDAVWDAFRIASKTGDWVDVDSRLDRVISKSKPAKETKKESPLDLDNLTKEQWEVVERKVMDKRGETKDDTGGPAGGMSDEKWLDEVYSKAKSDDHERAQKILDKLK